MVRTDRLCIRGLLQKFLLLMLELLKAAQLGFRFVRYFVVLDTPIYFARQILGRLLVILLHLCCLDEIEAEAWCLSTT